MSVEKLFSKYFIEYASYVIKDRAIPHVLDGFKPVQRRIIHTLMQMDDGRFHKVAGVVGAVMKYHPHGDASINDALVNLANAELFIDKQGNYGNPITGDSAAAGRYIECRLLPFAKKVLYSPDLTDFVDSYDGRNQEPVVFQAKIPVVLVQGTTGIAVGMKTEIMPHNLLEVLDAQIAALKGEDFELYPDFYSGGICDVSNYNDGKGFVTIRAKIDTSDEKKIVITEIPYGVTTEKLIESIEKKSQKSLLKISSIFDYSSDKANIEIALPKNTYANDENLVDSLFAMTACQAKISGFPIVIKDNMPCTMGVSEIVKYHAEHLLVILAAELENEKNKLLDKKHARTLERIFIEERIYKTIENKKTAEDVVKAVYKGFNKFTEELIKPIIDEDVDRLLKIPIRRISLFDIEKNKEELEQIDLSIQECDYNLEHITDFSINYLEDLKNYVDKDQWKRKTLIEKFEIKDIKDISMKNLDLKYDKEKGYIGTKVVGGEFLEKVSPLDKILIIKKDGTYKISPVEDKEFIGKNNLLLATVYEKEKIKDIIFSAIYKEKVSTAYYIKRFSIKSYIQNKVYSFIPAEGYKLIQLITDENAKICVTYKAGLGYRYLDETFYIADFKVSSSLDSSGKMLFRKKVEKLSLKKATLQNSAQEKLF